MITTSDSHHVFINLTQLFVRIIIVPNCSTETLAHLGHQLIKLFDMHAQLTDTHLNVLGLLFNL